MLSIEDELYRRFGKIVFDICGSYQIMDPRKDIEFPDREYYVYGIRYPNFLRPKNWEKSVTYRDFEDYKQNDPEMLQSMSCMRNDILTMGRLEILNGRMKEAGAKRVWIHHSKKYNKKTNSNDYNSTLYGQYLVVVDVTTDEEERPLARPHELEQVEIFKKKYQGKEAFDGVICNYCCGCKVYRPRKDIYTDKEYYVSGIDAPNFIESEDYDSTQDDELVERLREKCPEAADDFKKLFPVMFIRHTPSLSHLVELYHHLKDARAKEVWLIPTERYDEELYRVVDESWGEIGTFMLIIDY